MKTKRNTHGVTMRVWEFLSNEHFIVTHRLFFDQPVRLNDINNNNKYF